MTTHDDLRRKAEAQALDWRNYGNESLSNVLLRFGAHVAEVIAQNCERSAAHCYEFGSKDAGYRAAAKLARSLFPARESETKQQPEQATRPPTENEPMQTTLPSTSAEALPGAPAAALSSDPFLREQQLLEKTRKKAYNEGFQEGQLCERRSVSAIVPPVTVAPDGTLSMDPEIKRLRAELAQAKARNKDLQASLTRIVLPMPGYDAYRELLEKKDIAAEALRKAGA